MRSVLASAALCLALSCTVMEPGGHPLLTALDEVIQPESAGGRVALAAPALVLGSAALAIDAGVWNPLGAIFPAWLDTLESLWGPSDRGPFTQSLLFGPKVGWTPAHWAGRWWWRGMMGGGLGEEPFEVRDSFLEEQQ